MLKNIKKRNGTIADFDGDRIHQAIVKAADATCQKGELSLASLSQVAESVTTQVVDTLSSQYDSVTRIPDVETVQDTVEQKLVESGYFEIVRNFILYRAEHAQKRAEKRIEELRKIEQNLFKVTKSDGRKEIFAVDKLQALFQRVNGGFESSCAFDEVYGIFKTKIVDGISTKDVINTLKLACIDLITTDNIHWQTIAGRLYILQMYKQATHNRKVAFDALYEGDSFLAHFTDYVEKGLYYSEFSQYYSTDDLRLAASFIDKDRDFDYIYSTVLAFDKRYLNNPNGKLHELPQEMYLTIALFLAIPEKKEERMQVVQSIYEVTSSQQLSLPTPTLVNARTNFHQLASCFKLNADDDLRSIYHTIENIAQISKFGGGVGVYAGNIRSRGSFIRNVKNASGGVVPWIKVVNDTACAVNQLGARLGAVSPTLDIWHRDINDFLNLQTETGDIRAKAFDIFPAISVPDIFMKRAEADEVWTLLDPYEVEKVTGKRLQDHFGDSFDAFYSECEANEALTLKDTVKAKDLMKTFLKSAVETGMPYVFFRDTVNNVNPNKHAGNIYSTQLCTEICQNTSQAKFVSETEDEAGNVSVNYTPGDTVVCNLASINIAKVNTQEQIDKVFPVAMRILDNVITLNFYPIKEAALTAKKYRSVGLGFMGLAEYLACHQYRYDTPEAVAHVDELFEQYAFATLSASNGLAKERGTYELYKGSEWDKGVLFGRDASWYQEHAKTPEKWAGLFDAIAQHGLRFSYHLSPAPNTSTAGVVGTTAGLLPVYKKFYVETNAIAPVVTVAPQLSQENFWYYKEYINMDMHDVIDMVAAVYKWVDQSISFEWLINPEQTSPKELYEMYMKAWKSKIKTVYYLRSMSGDTSKVCESCAG